MFPEMDTLLCHMVCVQIIWFHGFEETCFRFEHFY